MSQRRRTAFADILREEPESPAGATELPPDNPPAPSAAVSPRRNKATSSEYTKLTAYIPRSLAAGIKMSMALDQTTDQSDYVERILAEWLESKGRDALLKQVGYLSVSP